MLKYIKFKRFRYAQENCCKNIKLYNYERSFNGLELDHNDMSCN